MSSASSILHMTDEATTSRQDDDEPNHQHTNIERNILAFGSCNDPYQYNALWPLIQNHQPTAFIWCGDAIYADKPSSSSLSSSSSSLDQFQSPSCSSTTTNTKNTSTTNDYSYWNRIRPYLPFISIPERRKWKSPTTTSSSSSYCATPDVFDRDYQQQLNVPGYQALRSSSSSSTYVAGENSSHTSSPAIPPHIFGTLDDNDYGCNNADRTYPYKYESGMAFLKFLNASSSSSSSSLPFSTSSAMMYQRGLRGEGIYGVQLYDFAQPKGPQRVISDWDANIDADLEQHTSSSSSSPNSNTKDRTYTYSNQTVAVFVLDVRTHKTPWKTHWYERFLQKDMDGDFLGAQQQEWLQQSVHNSLATIHIFVSGIQFHPYRYPDGNIAESWSQYPRAQQALYNIILSTNTPTILISGDVHMTQLLQKDCVPYHTILSHNDNNNNQPMSGGPLIPLPIRSLIEMTTSGMTHSWGTLAVPLLETAASSTRNTISSAHQHSYYDLYISYISKWMIHLLHYTCPWTDIISIPNNNRTTAKVGLQYSLEQNFGEIEMDFPRKQIHLRTIGTNAQPLLQLQYTFDELLTSPSDRGKTIDPTQQQMQPYLSMKDFQNEIRNNPQLYNHISKDDPNQWVCINHRGRDTTFQLMTGYMTSIALLTILAPLPVLVPSTMCLLLALLLLRLLRRRKRNNTNKRRKNTTTTADSIYLQPSRFLYSTRATTTNRQIIFQQPPISTFWRLTWMSSTVPESAHGKKSFFSSTATTHHHHHFKKC